MEETAYDLGNVFGVALLGTVAAVLFQARMGTGETGQSLAAARAGGTNPDRFLAGR